MQKQEIVNLIIKVLGLYLIVSAIVMIQYPAIMFSGQLIDSKKNLAFFISLFVSIVPVIITFGAGFMLIRKTDKFIPALTDASSKAKTEKGKLSAKEIQAIVFSVVGLYIFMTSVPELFKFGFQIVSQIGKTGVERLYIRTSWPNIISIFIKCLLGAALFLQARGMARFWYELQKTRGMNKK